MKRKMKNGILLRRDYLDKQMGKRKEKARQRTKTMISLGRPSGRQSRTVSYLPFHSLSMTRHADLIAWYFWNAQTGEVTWTNPLEPAPPLPSGPAPPASAVNPPLPKEAPPLPEPTFGQIPDIDPDLAYLLPGTQRGAGGDGQQATFNARTGRFQQADSNYAFDHLDEYNRAKRMAGKYFDVDSWEKNLREENAKRKRDEAMGVVDDKKITKKDMVSTHSLGNESICADDAGTVQEEKGRAEVSEAGLASRLGEAVNYHQRYSHQSHCHL
jgi:hypothetical protein